MLKTAARIGLAAALFAVSLVLADSGLAGATAPNATGVGQCRIYSGHGTLSPGLTPVGLAGGVKITFGATLTSPTGAPCTNSSVSTPAGVKIIGGTVNGSGFYNPPAGGKGSSCANFHGADTVAKIGVIIQWKTTGGPIANTIVVFSTNPGTVSGTPKDTIKLVAPPGWANKSGSFVAPISVRTVELVTNLPAPPCGPGPHANFTISTGFVLV